MKTHLLPTNHCRSMPFRATHRHDGDCDDDDDDHDDDHDDDDGDGDDDGDDDDHDVADCPSQLIYNGISICIKYITNIKPIAGYSANDVVDDNDDNYCRQLI